VNAPAAAAAPSVAPSQAAAPSDLAATGHPSQPMQPAGFPMPALTLGLLALTAGLAVTGIRKFARK
jgi:hypothetical protein